MIRIVFDVGIDRCTDRGDDAGDQTYTDRKEPGVIDVVDESAADKRRGNVADGADYTSPKLTLRKTWTASRCVLHGGTHAARVGEDLADGDESRKCDRESEPHDSV